MIISQMNKQHNNKIATDRYIKEKKLLIMRYSNFSLFLRHENFIWSLFSNSQHLIFVEWAIEIYVHKSDVNVNFFIKYDINHDLVASILLYYIANIYKICLIIVSYICIAIDITLLYTMIIKIHKRGKYYGTK